MLARALAQLATASFVLALPGHLLARAVRRPEDPLEHIALSLALSLAVVPAAAFSLAFLAGARMSWGLAVAAAALVSALARLGALRRGAPAPSGICVPAPPAAPAHALPLALLLALLLLFAGAYAPEHIALRGLWGPVPGSPERFWETCINRAVYCALQPAGEPGFLPDFGHGALYVAPLPGSLPENFLLAGGVAIDDQNIGATAVISLLVSFLGLLGFRAAFALVRALVVLLGYLLARRLFGGRLLPAAAAALLGLNALVSSLDALNENAIGLALSSLLLYIVVSPGGARRWLLAGLVLGTLGGVRYVAVLLLLPLAWRLSCERRPRQALLLLACGALACSVPWLFWGQRAFQSPFAFPGLRFFPEVEHTVLGRPFLFNGLLNWPFAERVVRTPHQPFPVFLLLPLALVRTYGLALSAAAVVGALSLWRERRELAVLLALWCAPLLALLAVQENWNLEKTTYLLLALPPIALAAAAGLGAVLHRPVPELGRAAALALLLALLVRGAARLRFDADPRWYAAAASDSRAAHLRSAPEDARSLDALREAYTRPSPLPELPDQLSRPRLDAALARELEAATSGEGLFDDPCRRLMLELDQLQVVMDATAGATRLRSSLVLPDAPRALSAALRAIPTAGSAPGGAAIDLSTEPGGPCTVLDARVERRGRELEVRLEPMGAALCGVSCARPREAAPGQPQVGQRTVAFVVPPGIYRVRVLVAGEPAAEAELSVV